MLLLQYGTNREYYINNTFNEFEDNLYKCESEAGKTEFETFLHDLELPTLSNEQKHVLDASITTEKILEVTQPLPVGKAPGPFNKHFDCELPLLMLEMYMESLKRGALPPTISQALISMKTDKKLVL